MSNSYAPINAHDGHAAINRPYTVGSATATFAARLAALPTASSTQGSTPPALPARESASSVTDDAMIMASTNNGINAAVAADSPCANVRAWICRNDTTAAIPASTTTLAIVVHRIYRSSRP